MTKHQSNTGKKEKQNKVWVDEEGIVYVKIVEMVDKHDISDLIEGLRKHTKGLSGELKIIVDTEDLRMTDSIRSSQFRKMAAQEAKDCVQDMPIGKVAIFGRSTAERTIASFVIAASQIKNMKIFKTEEEGLKWLKKP